MRRGTAYLNHMVFTQCLTYRSITSIWWMNKWRRGEKEVMKEEALRWKVWQWMRTEWLLKLVLANAKHLWHYRRSAPARLSWRQWAQWKQSGRPPPSPARSCVCAGQHLRSMLGPSPEHLLWCLQVWKSVLHLLELHTVEMVLDTQLPRLCAGTTPGQSRVCQCQPSHPQRPWSPSCPCGALSAASSGACMVFSEDPTMASHLVPQSLPDWLSPWDIYPSSWGKDAKRLVLRLSMMKSFSVFHLLIWLYLQTSWEQNNIQSFMKR